MSAATTWPDAIIIIVAIIAIAYALGKLFDALR